MITNSWDLWERFAHDALFLDIETTGLGHESQITVLGTLYKGQYRAFVSGVDLHEAWEYLSRPSLILTFNGKSFDVPFIQRYFGKTLAVPHIDLRFVTARFGYRGGLKKIEPQFGILRDGETKTIDGYQAVLLWKRHCRGDKTALKTLVNYNQADVEGLPVIMKGCWERRGDLGSVGAN